MIIGLDAGHTLSGYGTGASGVVKETDYNRLILNRLSTMLKEKGHTVINCTVDYSSNDLAERVKKANAQKLDLFLSIHLNAFSDSSANGVETYCYYPSGGEFNRAKNINNELANAIGWTNRGVKSGTGLYVIRNTKDSAILVELGFCTNKGDMDKWNTEVICKALFKGITNTNYTAPEAPVSPSNDLYRVRLSWSDVTSQKGAYSVLNNAISECNKHNGYSVYNSKGEKVYPKELSLSINSRVKVNGTHYATGQTIPSWVKNNVYTVQEISGDKVLLKEILSWVYKKDVILV